MLFTLEALNAKHGDSLLLHFGSNADPGLVVIDGGPAGVYKDILHPRLDALKTHRGLDADTPLPIRLLMVSHIDDDHVKGVLELVDQLRDAPGAKPYDITTLWFNSFDGILGHLQGEIAAEYAPAIHAASIGDAMPVDFSDDPEQAHHAGMILANVPQGNMLRGAATTLGLMLNEGFSGLVKLPQAGAKTIDFSVEGDGSLTFTVLGPRVERLQNLGNEWDTFKSKKTSGEAKAADFIDNSVFNLSSIIVLVEAGGKTMLLTGDARGDDIMTGLAAAGKMPTGTFHCDILKMPHHGSWRDMSEAFLTKVTADHYVISANGKYSNPDFETMQALSKVCGNRVMTVHITNPLEVFAHSNEFDIAALTQLLEADKALGKPYKVVFRDSAQSSIVIDLGDETLQD